jgi:hypothetical protein
VTIGTVITNSMHYHKELSYSLDSINDFDYTQDNEDLLLESDDLDMDLQNELVLATIFDN